MSVRSDRNGWAAALLRVAARPAAVFVLAGILAAIYLFLIRPAQLRWGATDEEVARPMPEDGLVASPAFDATRAITINARPEQIWPWVAQMGYRRAGFYGYDLIENIASGTGLRSAQTILPRLQDPHPGDELPISGVASIMFGGVERNRYLVWRGTEVPPNGVFIWQLVPENENQTRLISRIRWRYHAEYPARALDLFTEFGDHVAVRAVLHGIRNLAEGRGTESLFAQGAEIAGWLLGMMELAVGAVFVLCWRRWRRAWLLALGAGLLLQFVLYGAAPVWASAPLPWLYLALMVWCWRRERSPQRFQAPA